jgi:hypothetical protein
MKQQRTYLGMAVLLAALLSACAQKGPILVDFAYERPARVETEPTPAVVAVSPFKDDRGKTESLVGKRYNSLNDQANDLVVQGIVADRVTKGLKQALKDRDITVKDVSSWDFTDAGIPAEAGKLLISGEIKTLWVEATSSFANTKVKANVELRILLADTAQKKIFRTLTVSSATERQNISFSPEFVDEVLTEAVSIALNQIFNDEELKSRLK